MAATAKRLLEKSVNDFLGKYYIASSKPNYKISKDKKSDRGAIPNNKNSGSLVQREFKKMGAYKTC